MTKEKKVKYSYSRLDCLDQCGFRYYLKYILGNFSKTGSVALEFGTAIHKVEEEIGNYIKDGLQIPYDSLLKNFIDTCVKIENRYPEDFRTPDKTGRTYAEKINFYVNTGVYRLENYMKDNPDLEILGCEIPFTFNFNGEYLFRGSIDRALRNKKTGQYIVQDIKSFGVPLKDNGPGNRDEHLVTPLQFVTYCIAMSELYPVDPTTIRCQYDLPLCDKLQDAGTKGYIGRGRGKLTKLFSRIKEEDWTCKPSPLCRWCEFSRLNPDADLQIKFLCPYHMNWTREHHDFSKENEWTGIEQYPSLLEAYHKKYRISVIENKDTKKN